MNRIAFWNVGAALVIAGAALPMVAFGVRVPEPSENWVEVGVATDGTRALVDTNSIVVQHGNSRVRQRFLLSNRDGSAVSQVDQEAIYACETAEVMTLRSTELDKAGRMRRQDTAADMQPYVAEEGSLPHLIKDALC